jgi:hypothetical protein
MPNHFAGLDEEESPIMAAELSNSDGAIWDGTFCPCKAQCDHGMHIENDGSWSCQHLEISQGRPMMFAWDKTDWADIMEMEEPDEATIAEENEAFAQRNGGMTIAMLLAEAAKELAKAPVIMTPFVPFAMEADPWARNANGSKMCCRNHAYKGEKGAIAPAENGFAAGCVAHTAGLPCVGTHEGTPLFGKRFVHIDDDDWPMAQPREQGSTRPSSAGDWRSGAATPTWRSGTSTPAIVQRQGCTNPLCRLPSGAQMTNHVLATCGKPGGGAHKGRR